MKSVEISISFIDVDTVPRKKQTRYSHTPVMHYAVQWYCKVSKHRN